jgi:coproporphyrinogen III oxidase
MVGITMKGIVINRARMRQVGTTLIGLSFFSRSSKNNDPPEASLETEDFRVIQKSDAFMAEPLTDREVLLKEKHLMRRRMELFILRAQKNVFESLKQLEVEESKRQSDESMTNKDEVPNDIKPEVDDMISIDRWVRKEGGGGITCIIQNGRVFEKAGVNISVVYGILPPQAVQQMRSRGKKFNDLVKESTQVPFFAAGISSVVHPRNPHVPTIHFNYRYFEVDQPTLENDDSGKMWWFGGGTDLTPYILNEDDCKLFHSELKKACDKHDATYYGKFKKWCDDYFYIVHRNERRGVGGLFFDDIDFPDQERAFSFVRSCAQHILPSYMPLVLSNMHKPYSAQDREWQLLRRGRYTEFNLVYDRGTKFGLFTPGARYESILMSLPLYAKWLYCHEPEAGSIYAKLMDVLKEPREWV